DDPRRAQTWRSCRRRGSGQGAERRAGRDQRLAATTAAGNADAKLRYVLYRHLHPPAGAGAGGEPADSADRSQGDDRTADPPVSQALEYDDYGNDDLPRRLARFDPGLYHDADLASGVDRRGHR